jgi:sigma-B regulation protein RsbU (phosphoserine phosphatase)
MGIEDFNVDLDDYADRVLVMSPNAEVGASIGELLEKRSYQWSLVCGLEAASILALETLFDLLIIDQQEPTQDAAELLAAVAADIGLSRSPALLIHPDARSFQSGAQSVFGPRVSVIPAPLEPSTLLVKVATSLRLNKIKSEQAGFESRLSSQNAQLRDLNNRFKQELKSARDIQQSLFPRSLPTAPNCVFAACCVPLEAVGGDLYDIWKIERGRYGMFLGDVTGHGLSAAFIGAMTKMALEYAPKESPEVMLAHVNDGLCKHIPAGTFVTAVAAFVEPITGSLLVSRAGHPPPYLWRAASKDIELVEPRGLPLGVNEGMPYEMREIQLEPGDKFLMITDGLTETIDMNGEMLGVEGIGKIFATSVAAGMSIADCIARILSTQEEFTGGRLLKDDNTLIGFEYDPKPKV